MDKRENMDRMNDENGCDCMPKILYRLCSQSIIIRRKPRKIGGKSKVRHIILRKYPDKIQIISWIFTKNPRFHRKKDALSKNGHFFVKNILLTLCLPFVSLSRYHKNRCNCLIK